MPNSPRRFDRAGYSAEAFAEVLGMSGYQVRAAIRKGQIKTVPFGPVDRIPKSEAPRIAALLGIELREPSPPKSKGRPRKRRLVDAAE